MAGARIAQRTPNAKLCLVCLPSNSSADTVFAQRKFLPITSFAYFYVQLPKRIHVLNWNHNIMSKSKKIIGLGTKIEKIKVRLFQISEKKTRISPGDCRSNAVQN